MHYNLLFNGCSFTVGADLEGLDENVDHREKHRFSHLVSEKTGLTHDNIAVIGCSNNSILRRTVEWFEQGNTCDHAIIQWTTNLRRSHFIENHKFFEFRCNDRGKHNAFNELHCAYIELQNPSNDQYDEDMCKYWMQDFLKDKCSSFYLKMKEDEKACDSYYKNSIYSKCTSDMQVPHIIGDILQEQIYYVDSKQKSVFKDDRRYMVQIGGHPNELGHARIADYIVNNDDYFKSL